MPHKNPPIGLGLARGFELGFSVDHFSGGIKRKAGPTSHSLKGAYVKEIRGQYIEGISSTIQLRILHRLS